MRKGRNFFFRQVMIIAKLDDWVHPGKCQPLTESDLVINLRFWQFLEEEFINNLKREGGGDGGGSNDDGEYLAGQKARVRCSRWVVSLNSSNIKDRAQRNDRKGQVCNVSEEERILRGSLGF